ncbi:hypothetical protein EVAR_46137_1 [Eumeta japonica]|uniref:Uncharacterized protein n=1 Tax=Eumeta variegata TaxID=151549 RepID=A0A4C1XR24_EUMVA|nr:hypothetical protein EVAR_46137_1 [Eumeta japonica]
MFDLFEKSIDARSKFDPKPTSIGNVSPQIRRVNQRFIDAEKRNELLPEKNLRNVDSSDSAFDNDSGSDLVFGSIQNVRNSPAAPPLWTYDENRHILCRPMTSSAMIPNSAQFWFPIPKRCII